VSTADPPGTLAALARIRRPAQSEPVGRCELCTATLAEEHRHISDMESRTLLCACRPCALLFTRDGAAGGRYRAVPERYLAVSGFELSRPDWEALQIPVTVAFFFRNSSVGDMAGFYPSPAGATECLLPLDAWKQVEVANPVVGMVEADVEAVLIRCGSDVIDCFVVPIDSCYQLVGTLRRLWRGFDGGREARDALTEYFAQVEARARRVSRTGDG
jgi:Family of unknown function (DUF5947)